MSCNTHPLSPKYGSLLTPRAVLLVDSLLDWLAVKARESSTSEEIEDCPRLVAEVDSALTESSNIPIAPIEQLQETPTLRFQV